jgi:hypothetical protein
VRDLLFRFEIYSISEIDIGPATLHNAEKRGP